MTADHQHEVEAATAFAHALVTAAINRELHPVDHRFVQESLRELVDALAYCVEIGVEMPLQLQFDRRLVHYAGTPLDGPSLQAGKLLRCLAARDIAMISVQPHLSVDEAGRLLDLLVLDENIEAFDRNHRDRALRAFGIRNAAFTLASPADPSDRRAPLAVAEGALQTYQDLAESLQRNHALAYRDLALAIDEAAGIVERAMAEFDEPSTLLALATQDDVDRFTVGHSVRVALLALQVARRLGLERDQLVSVGTAALMHDIGKSKVPQEILWKRGHLSDQEWRLMAQHPRLGAQLLLEQHASIDPCAIGAAFCHHMGPHGNGYPRPALPILPSGTSHLIRICDVFEALTSARPYKKALSPVEAFTVMFRSDRDFEPQWLRFFARTIGLFPTGTRVLLDDGSDGVVIGQSRNPAEPVVRLIAGAAGATLSPGEPDRVVIGQPLAGKTRRIAAISTHERCVLVPDLGPADTVMTTPHACLSEQLARDANAIAKKKSDGDTGR